ncbi:MAG: hypothetical protein P4M13_01905 [Alphaproteobacteria bacterium]|nr:hypothetical protein [Alphaproteobacteria bacterium]
MVEQTTAADDFKAINKELKQQFRISPNSAAHFKIMTEAERIRKNWGNTPDADNAVKEMVADTPYSNQANEFIKFYHKYLGACAKKESETLAAQSQSPRANTVKATGAAQPPASAHRENHRELNRELNRQIAGTIFAQARGKPSQTTKAPVPNASAQALNKYLRMQKNMQSRL